MELFTWSLACSLSRDHCVRLVWIRRLSVYYFSVYELNTEFYRQFWFDVPCTPWRCEEKPVARQSNDFTLEYKNCSYHLYNSFPTLSNKLLLNLEQFLLRSFSFLWEMHSRLQNSCNFYLKNIFHKRVSH